MCEQPVSVYSLSDSTNAVIRSCEVLLIKHLRDGQTLTFLPLGAKGDTLTLDCGMFHCL